MAPRAKQPGRPQARTALLPFPRAQRSERRAHQRRPGRKPKGGVAGVSHRQRQALTPRHPVHLTIKLRPGLPSLRRKPERTALLAAFTAAQQARSATSFRLCHYTVLNDHLHLMVEVEDRQALSRGIQGLLVRIARALNKLWHRRGTVFADRYHDRVLKTPREVRNALQYVLHNAHHHAAEGRMVSAPHAIDLYSSAPWFAGFVEQITIRNLDAVPCPIRPARTWLLGTGWKRLGLLPLAPPLASIA